MTSTQSSGPWSSGTEYEAYMGRWSRLVAAEFLHWVAAPAGRTWLDVGCGSGALTQTILEMASPAAVRGVDPSAGFVAYAQTAVSDPRATFEVGDAQHLQVSDNSFDIVVSGLALNFFPDPAHGLGEMVRAVRQAGQVAAYVWDYAGGMELMRYFWDAAAEIEPGAAALQEWRRFSWCVPGRLQDMLRSAGLSDVESRPIVVPTTFADFDDYWQPLLGGVGPAPAFVGSLEDSARHRLREALLLRLPFAADGSIPLTARAWGVLGRL